MKFYILSMKKIEIWPCRFLFFDLPLELKESCYEKIFRRHRPL
jgi:hypothetical protein